MTADNAFMVFWLPWAALCAWLPRHLAVRRWGRAYGLGAYFIGYFSWVLLFATGMLFITWTGMQLYGFDRSDSWQLAGWATLMFTPFGLPVLYGAPFVVVLDLMRWVAKRLPFVSPTPSQLANPALPRED